MKTVTSFPQLVDNIGRLQALLDSTREEDRDFAQELIRNGISFVVFDLPAGVIFAPSRFVGYQRNSRRRHSTNLKDGRETSLAIAKLVGGVAEPDPWIEREYAEYCAGLGISFRQNALFNVVRKFWDLRGSEGSERSARRFHDAFAADIARSLRDSDEQRRARLKKAPKLPSKASVVVQTFRRNPDVVAEVLIRAAGTCEACGSPAPFIRRSDKTPFLEVHHRVQLAHGGEDTVENAVALCPNCHRLEHYG